MMIKTIHSLNFLFLSLHAKLAKFKIEEQGEYVPKMIVNSKEERRRDDLSVIGLFTSLTFEQSKEGAA